MTICVAVICNERKGVFCVADAMVTADYPLAITMEQAPKIIEFTQNSVIMTAGNALGHTELLDDALTQLEELDMKNPTIRDYCEVIKGAYAGLRKRKLDELYLRPRGLALEDESGGLYARRMSPELLANLDGKIEDFDLNVAALLAGVDRKGAHIYEIFDPGSSECFDAIGFDAIGIGNIHAIHSLIADNYDSALPRNAALPAALKAKHAAERAPGVGAKTGACYISEKGIERVEESEIGIALGESAKRAK